jgi:hypothetical protein
LKPAIGRFARLKRRVKLTVGNKVLDIAEALPSFNGGFIQNLQYMRRNLRKHIEQDFTNMRLPEGAHLELPRIFMFQVYPIEDIDILTRSMERTFGNDKFRRSSEPLEDVKRSESSLWAGSWSLLGHLSRNKSSFFYPVGHRYVQSLPSEVSDIDIRLYKVFPSTFVILFSVSLNSQVSDALNAFYKKKYLGTIEFRHFLPVGRWSYASSHGFAESVRREAIASYLDSVFLRAERQIKKFFPEPRISRNTRLPVLRDIRLVLPVGADPSLEIPGSIRWGGGLGLGSLTYDAYRDGNTFFSFSDDNDDDKKLWTLFTSYSGALSENEDRHLSGIAEALVPMLAIRNLLDEVAREIGSLRVKAYRRVIRSGRFIRFRKDLRLSARLQIQKFIADRLRTERKAGPDSLGLWRNELCQFKHTRIHNYDLYSGFLQGLDGMESLISQHSQLVVGLYKSYVEARNLEVSYRLSRRVLLWTILVTILTVVSCLATYDQSAKQLIKIRDSVTQHIASTRKRER